MWAIYNCSIVSYTPSHRQQYIAGSTTICRTDEPKFISVNNNPRANMVKQEWYQDAVLSPEDFIYYLAEIPTPPMNIKLIMYSDDNIIYTSGQVMADLFNGLNIYLPQVHTYIKKKYWLCLRPNMQ